MSAELWFVDPNMLVYVFDDDSPCKQKVARELLDKEADRIVLSTLSRAQRVLRDRDAQARKATRDRPSH